MERPSDEDLEKMYEQAMDEKLGQIPKTSLQDTPKAQLLHTRALIVEMSDLRDALDKHRKWSTRLSGLLIVFTFALLVIAGLQLYSM